jgi:hypothetical protein
MLFFNPIADLLEATICRRLCIVGRVFFDVSPCARHGPGKFVTTEQLH